MQTISEPSKTFGFPRGIRFGDHTTYPVGHTVQIPASRAAEFKRDFGSDVCNITPHPLAQAIKLEQARMAGMQANAH